MFKRIALAGSLLLVSVGATACDSWEKFWNEFKCQNSQQRDARCTNGYPVVAYGTEPCTPIFWLPGQCKTEP